MFLSFDKILAWVTPAEKKLWWRWKKQRSGKLSGLDPIVISAGGCFTNWFEAFGGASPSGSSVFGMEIGGVLLSKSCTEIAPSFCPMLFFFRLCFFPLIMFILFMCTCSTLIWDISLEFYLRNSFQFVLTLSTSLFLTAVGLSSSLTCFS